MPTPLLEAPERRFGDRRHAPTPMLSRYTFHGGRRSAARRAEDDRATFVDLYGGRLFLVALAIIALNLLDAWFTLLFLAQGGHEVNPFVQRVLNLGPAAFIAFKTLGIGACVVLDRKSTRLNSSHLGISYAVFCLKKKKTPPHLSTPH